MDWYSNGGKSGLIRDVMAKGFSVRRSEKAVNAVFDCMRQALARDETVEVPGGSLRVQLWNGRASHRFQNFRHMKNGLRFFRRVGYPGRRRVIRFDPDLSLNLDHCAEYPPPTIPITACPWLFKSQDPKQAEIWKLAAELLGAPVDTATVAVLQEAADRYSRHPEALLHMLRRRRERGHRQPTLEALAHDLTTAGFR